jgi:hypothetical protein
MSKNDDIDSIRATLKSEPSVLGWEFEIRELLYGNRSFAVVQLGSPQEYVEVLLEESDDKARAETSFHEALRNVIYAWHPSRPESEAFLANMLALVAAFMPPEGFTKILGFMRAGFSFGQNTTAPLQPEAIRTLHRQALATLAYYYQVPPPAAPQPDLGFASYVEMLRQHLRYEQYCDYALRRLYELHVIQLDANEVLDCVRRTFSVLEELVPIVLEREIGTQLEESLSKIYAHCLRIQDGPDAFERALSLRSASLQHDESGPLVLKGSELLELHVPESLIELYLEIRWNRAPTRGLSKLAFLDATGTDLSN